MSEKQLLLPSAKIGIPVRSRTTHFGEQVLLVVGIFVVLYGLVNVLLRLSHYIDAAAIQTAFTPLGQVPLQQPSIPQAGASSAPAFATTVATTTPLTPTRIAIPSISVNTTVEEVGQKADGSMATPSSRGGCRATPDPRRGPRGSAPIAMPRSDRRGRSGDWADRVGATSNRRATAIRLMNECCYTPRPSTNARTA